MQPPVVTGYPIRSRLLLVGQAPGDKEGRLGRPFAWTAGKTLFRWLASLGVSEDAFRGRVYMSAVCRCFPGKNPKGGDRVPDVIEIANCATWLSAELDLIRPDLVVAVGKLAINRFVAADRLTEVVGQVHRIPRGSAHFDLIPLPHPSGASTWHRREPGKSLLDNALLCLSKHPVWLDIRTSQAPCP